MMVMGWAMVKRTRLAMLRRKAFETSLKREPLPAEQR